MTDKPQTFAARIVKAREKLASLEAVDFSWRASQRGFDAAVAVCEAEIAEKDAEIARWKACTLGAEQYAQENERTISDDSQTLDEKIAEARERFARFNGAFRYADPEIDVIVAACGAAFAEKDDEIARLKAALEEEKWETAAVNHDVEFSVAKGKEMARLAHAESRTVTDAQRERIYKRLELQMHRVTATQLGNDILAILEEQPAAEGAP